MDRLRLPAWAPYLAFVAVVAMVIAFSVATRGDSKEPAASGAVPVNQPLETERLSGAKEPREVVLRLWQLVQQGNYPLATLLYHPRVVQAFGAERVMGALALQRQTVLQYPPVVKNTERTPLGTIVTVETDADRPILFSFNVLKRKGRWAIAFDSLLGEALPQYVQGLAPKAKGAGEKAASRYRSLFLPRGVPRRQVQRRAESSPRQSVETAPRPESPTVPPPPRPESPSSPAITPPGRSPSSGTAAP